ncbi:MAG: signal recognition particle-docking protein FtsY [Ktedonobacterales bacterium]
MFKRLGDLFKRPEDTAGAEQPAEFEQPEEFERSTAPAEVVTPVAPAEPESTVREPLTAEPVIVAEPGLAAEEAAAPAAHDDYDDVVAAPAALAEDARGSSASEPPSEAHRGLFKNPFKAGLGRTRQLFGRVSEAFEADEEISDDLWDELEETLITGDVGVRTTDKLMANLRKRVAAEGLTHARQLRDALKDELELMLGAPEPLVFSDTSPISVFLVVGVNGVGKTTTIAKLASVLKRQKHRVMLAAGDTFRAAAIEQLRMWGDRVGLPVISHQHGADPGAVVYDAMQAAQARGIDVLLVDTAGRLHTKFNLMAELKKIVGVLQKYDPEAPHEVLLVMDATTGQNGFLQAKQFVQDAGVSGIILTKLDSTARGGIVFAVASELGLPVKYVGTGEQLGDLAPFDPQEFVDALFDAD